MVPTNLLRYVAVEPTARALEQHEGSSAFLIRFAQPFKGAILVTQLPLTNYTDLSPSFRSEMGFVRRVDLRQGSQYASYLWHTEGRHLLSFGPTVSVSADWDHQGQLQDWNVTPAFVANFAGQTSLRVGHSQGYEFFSGIGFRESSTYTSFYTSLVKWMSISASYGRGTAINYFPAAGLLIRAAHPSR